jgi:hypothetical protein
LTWTGNLPVESLRTGLVSPALYGNWEECRKGLLSRRGDTEAMDSLRRSIAEYGIRKPLLLAMATDSPAVLMDDGQHRALIALELNLAWVPVRWGWLRWGRRPEGSAPPVNVMDALGMEER